MVVLSSTLQNLVAGTFAGLVSTAGLYPLELIKTRMQVIDGQDQAYRSLRTSLRIVIKNEGLRGLYQGMAPAMFAASGSWGGYFYFYEASKERKVKNRAGKLNSVDHLLSGVEAGVILVLIFNPFWVVKTRLALQGAETGLQKSLRDYFCAISYKDALATIAREEGLRGLYKGLVPALFLTSHGAIQFAVYESMKTLFETFRLSEDKARQPAYVSAVIGGGSKIIASTITYPYQVVKSRLQQRDQILTQAETTAESVTATPKYNGTIDCVKKIWRQDGIRGFFRGVIPNALKVAPSAALTFLVYEESMLFLKALNADAESPSSN